MGILEMKREFKKNVIGDTVKNIYHKATEKKDKSQAIIELNQTKKKINNSRFEVEYNNLENDLRLQDLKDNLTMQQCNMLIRKSRNKGKLDIVKKDTSNLKTNVINVIFSLISGILSCAGIFISYNNNVLFGVLFGVLMCAVTTSNSCYIQIKMFDTLRLKKNRYVKGTIIGYIVACSSCLVISLITNKITMDKLLQYCTLNDIYKMILSVTFTLLFDIVPLLNNSIRYNFNMCLYNQETNTLLNNNVDTDISHEYDQKNDHEEKPKNDQKPTNTIIGVVNNNSKKPTKKPGRPGRPKERTQKEFDEMILNFNNGEIITPGKLDTTWNGTYKRLRDNCKYIQKDDNGRYVVNK